jgi:hypothetical protein
LILTIGVIKSKKRGKIAIIISIFLFLSSLFFVIIENPQMKHKFSIERLSADMESNWGRITIWKSSLSIFKKNPIHGVGPGNFSLVIAPYTKWQIIDAHNIFLNFLSETGIIGFILFILIIFYTFFLLFKVDKSLRNLSFVIFLSFLGVLIQNLATTSLFRAGSLMVIFFFFLSLVNSLHIESKEKISYKSKLNINFLMNGIIITILFYFVFLTQLKKETPFLIHFIISLSFSLSYLITYIFEIKKKWNREKTNFPVFNSAVFLVSMFILITFSYNFSLSHAYSWHGIQLANEQKYDNSLIFFEKAVKSTLSLNNFFFFSAHFFL